MDILSNNPFINLTEIFNPIAMQLFIVAMVALVIIGTVVDIIHKKNVQYFFNNAKKAKLSATKELGSGERIVVIGSDSAQTSSGFGLWSFQPMQKYLPSIPLIGL